MKYIVPEQLHTLVDGTVKMPIRVGEDPICIGDWYGFAKVLKLETYGHEFQELGCGMTGIVTFDRMPSYVIVSGEHDKEYCEERQARHEKSMVEKQNTQGI